MRQTDRTVKRAFYLGALCMGGAVLLANSLHWFITPAAYGASSGQRIGVVAQAAVALAVALWGYARFKRLPAVAVEKP
jgi:hypothetical protein